MMKFETVVGDLNPCWLFVLHTEVVKVFGDGFGLLGWGFALVQEDLWLLEDILVEVFEQGLVWHRFIRCHFLCVGCVFLLRYLAVVWWVSEGNGRM